MTETSKKAVWGARIGWLVLLLVFVAFIWGMNRRARLEATGANVIRMLFVPSVEQGTLVERGDELARFIRRDSGLILRSEVPTSYAAVIQALGSGQADVAWMPAFAYVIAHARYGAEAKLQVVRSLERFAVVVTRTADSEPSRLSDLAGRRIAFPRSLHPGLADDLRSRLTGEAPGWIEVPVESDTESVERLVSSAVLVDAAVSSFVHSGPFDFVGDGLDQRQAQPGSLHVVHQAGADAVEALKDAFQLVFRDADAVVRYRDGHFVTCVGEFDADPAVTVGILDRVIQQVGNGPVDGVGIERNLGQRLIGAVVLDLESLVTQPD